VDIGRAAYPDAPAANLGELLDLGERAIREGIDRDLGTVEDR
jgi:hypothetical protein